MAVNHVDGTLFSGVLLYPIVTAMAAFNAGARWSTVLFFVAALAFGLGLTYVARKLFYVLLEPIISMDEEAGEASLGLQLLYAPMLLGYMLYPYFVMFAGLYSCWFATRWLLHIVF